MKYFFSISNNAFFNDLNGSSIPEDAKEITKQLLIEMLESQRLGKIIAAGHDGMPISKDEAQPSVIDLLNQVKTEIRSIREPMLSAVTGIGWEASEAGDAALVAEARAIRNALRDITFDPALNAAQTYEEMRAAGMAAYRSIAAGASPAFAATFKEFTGA